MGNKRVVMLIAQNNFRDEEFNQPKRIFEEKNIDVKVASGSRATAKGMFGTEVDPDLSIGDIKIDDLDALVMVGGSGAREYFDNPDVISLVQQAADSGKVLGAICIAPVILANAGILGGKKAAVFPSEENSLKMHDVICTGNKVERDGRIITGSGPEAADEFGNTIVDAL